MAHSSSEVRPAQRPPLRSLEIVCAVAHCGSLSGAAKQLGMTHGAASRHVKAIENWLGVKLFDRHGRGVRPTAEGLRFLNQVETGLDVIEAAAERWRARRGSSVVRVGVTPTFAKLWLLEKLPRLEEGAPKIRVEVLAQQGFAEVERGEVDFAIRYMRRARARDTDRLLLEEKLAPVAAPSILERIGTVPQPATILDQALLHETDASKWRAWAEHSVGGQFKPGPFDRRFEDYVLALTAGEAGLGVALGQFPLSAAHIDKSNLERVKGATVDSPYAYYIVAHDLNPSAVAVLSRLYDLLVEDFGNAVQDPTSGGAPNIE